MKTKRLTADSFAAAASLLEMDMIGALPAETVYGLAGNATSREAVLKIFEAKARPANDPLIVHVGVEHANVTSMVKHRWIKAPDAKRAAHYDALMKAFWPGPLTLIFPRGDALPTAVTSGLETVAVRCPSHPLFQKVLAVLRFPLAAPSANRFGRVSPTTADAALQELDGRITFVLDGGSCDKGVESTIVGPDKADGLKLFRPGAIALEALETATGTRIAADPEFVSAITAAEAPGQLESHYAPEKKLILFAGTRDSELMRQLAKACEGKRVALMLASREWPELARKLGARNVEILSDTASDAEASRALFGTLRHLDSLAVDLIVAEQWPTNDGLGRAIRDRLFRASVERIRC